MRGRCLDVIAEEKVNSTPDGVEALLRLAEVPSILRRGQCTLAAVNLPGPASHFPRAL
jgi:hypothetical protein